MLWLFPTFIFPHPSNGFNSNKNLEFILILCIITPSLLITRRFNSIIHFSVTIINFPQVISTFTIIYTFYSILGLKSDFDLEIHFVLEIWPWPWKLTLTFKNDLDLQLWPWPSTLTLTFNLDLKRVSWTFGPPLGPWLCPW